MRRTQGGTVLQFDVPAFREVDEFYQRVGFFFVLVVLFLLFLFFFFRIFVGVGFFFLQRINGRLSVERDDQPAAAVHRVLRRRELRSRDVFPPERRHEIGRASCRERV